MSDISNVFSEKDLPSTSESQPRATEISYFVLRVTWTGQKLKGMFSVPGTGDIFWIGFGSYPKGCNIMHA